MTLHGEEDRQLLEQAHVIGKSMATGVRLAIIRGLESFERERNDGINILLGVKRRFHVNSIVLLTKPYGELVKQLSTALEIPRSEVLRYALQRGCEEISCESGCE